MTYEVEVFYYNPKEMDVSLLQKFYKDFGITSPSEAELREPFHKDDKKGLEYAVTKYEPLTKAQAIELLQAAFDIEHVYHVEISDMKKFNDMRLKK